MHMHLCERNSHHQIIYSIKTFFSFSWFINQDERPVQIKTMYTGKMSHLMCRFAGC